MSKYVLMRNESTRGAALYVDGVLSCTWDYHDPDDYVMGQVEMRTGGAGVVERKWAERDWPGALKEDKPKAKPKQAPLLEPAAPSAEGADAE
jgi:hypothetical protein